MTLSKFSKGNEILGNLEKFSITNHLNNNVWQYLHFIHKKAVAMYLI